MQDRSRCRSLRSSGAIILGSWHVSACGRPDTSMRASPATRIVPWLDPDVKSVKQFECGPWSWEPAAVSDLDPPPAPSLEGRRVQNPSPFQGEGGVRVGLPIRGVARTGGQTHLILRA